MLPITVSPHALWSSISAHTPGLKNSSSKPRCPSNGLLQHYPVEQPSVWYAKKLRQRQACRNIRLCVQALCGALAAGVTHSGQLLESMGTSGALLAVSDTFEPTHDLLEAGYTSYAYVIPNTYVTLGSLSFAGGSLEWIITLLYGEGKTGTATGEIYAQALREAAEVAPGSRNATILPYFLGASTPFL